MFSCADFYKNQIPMKYKKKIMSYLGVNRFDDIYGADNAEKNVIPTLLKICVENGFEDLYKKTQRLAIVEVCKFIASKIKFENDGSIKPWLRTGLINYNIGSYGNSISIRTQIEYYIKSKPQIKEQLVNYNPLLHVDEDFKEECSQRAIKAICEFADTLPISPKKELN
jgi:hypothetical protein